MGYFPETFNPFCYIFSITGAVHSGFLPNRSVMAHPKPFLENHKYNILVHDNFQICQKPYLVQFFNIVVPFCGPTSGFEEEKNGVAP